MPFIVISRDWGWAMRLGWGSRQADQRVNVARALVVCAAAFALFLARSSSPQFADPLSAHTIKADAHHDQRPRFDNSTPRYSPATWAFAIAPPNETHARLSLATVLFFSFATKGIHYNRPPPLFSL
jgi:hypothetical protein